MRSSDGGAGLWWEVCSAVRGKEGPGRGKINREREGRQKQAQPVEEKTQLEEEGAGRRRQ